jgi:hypothetical protein
VNRKKCREIQFQRIEERYKVCMCREMKICRMRKNTERNIHSVKRGEETETGKRKK